MRIIDWLRPPPKPIEDNPPSYKHSDAAVFTYRFINSIESIRNVAVIKSSYTKDMYINTAESSRKLMKSIEKGDDEKALNYLEQVRFHSNNLFANINIPILHKNIYTSREIFRNIEAILYDKN